MVFQNKLNVAQYFVICFIFMLSFFFSSNASAINLHTWRTVSSAEWLFFGNGSTQTAPTAYNSIISNIQFNPAGQRMQLMSDMKLNLNNSANVSKTKKFKFDTIFSVETGSSEITLATPMCPLGKGSFVIDDCYFEELSQVQAVTTFKQFYYSTGGGNLQGWSADDVSGNYFYILHIIGHYNSNNDTSISSINLSRPYFTVYNSFDTQDAYPIDVELTLFFSTIQFYSEDESAEDKAAQKELESTTNIENQTSQNTTGGTSENQQTTNLIGVFSGFLTELQSFSATDCNLDLPFPSFIGGTQTVNICQGKDVLGNFITVVGTLAMLTFYIPLCFVLLKMIYNEIRSFTNG